jgi:diguanylate cyclase (GGDEF)-like protein
MDLFISRRTNDVSLLSLLLTLLIVASIVVLGNRFLQPVTNAGSPSLTNDDFPIYLNDHQVAVDTGRRTRYLEDPDQEYQSPEAVLDIPLQKWKTIPTDNIALPTKTNTVWYRLPIKNETSLPLTQRLEVRWPNLRNVDFYLNRDSSMIIHAQRGLLEPNTDQREISSYPNFQFTLSGNQRAELLIKIHTEYRQYAPLYFWPENAYQEALVTRTGFYGIAIGALISMLLFNLFIGVRLKSKAYLSYTAYISAVILYQLSLTGFGPYSLWASSTYWRLTTYEISVTLSFLTSGLFIRYLLKPTRLLKHLNSVIIIYWTVSTVSALGHIHWLRSVNEIMVVFSVLTAWVTGLLLWSKGQRAAAYFNLAWTAVIIATVVVSLMIYGIINYDPIIEFAQLIAIVLEVLLLSFALADQMQRDRISRILAEQKNQSLMRHVNQEREARHQAQLSLITLQKEQNSRLELEVTRRTQELEAMAAQLEAANKRLSEISLTDPLTGLFNRRFLDESLESAIKTAARTHSTLSLMMIDIDHFKMVNDQYGHLAGDSCLRSLAINLRHLISRSTDRIARYGGEEFAIILPGTEPNDLAHLAEQIRDIIEKTPVYFNGNELHLTVSIGCASINPSEYVPALCFVEMCDRALYEAKENGRNQVRCSFNVL